ncbi:MAG: hypothetical protein F4Z30_01720 [Gemmatimonadetes bacterium]|nr:hypothetical protein [Gemmatimonadota bacterium]
MTDPSATFMLGLVSTNTNTSGRMTCWCHHVKTGSHNTIVSKATATTRNATSTMRRLGSTCGYVR